MNRIHKHTTEPLPIGIFACFQPAPATQAAVLRFLAPLTAELHMVSEKEVQLE